MSGVSERAWHRLDNAAKLFPPTSSKHDTKVFRFCCELSDFVDGLLLQSALESTIEDFPGFRYILKRGIFWYYLEQSNIIPVAHEENTPPCSTAYLNIHSLLFDVSWYGRRINLEVYHALTDGTGAMQFLKALAFNYLKRTYPQSLQNVTGIDYDASEFQKLSDSYNKFYDKNKSGEKTKKSAAYQIKGTKVVEGRLKIIEGTVSTKAILDKSRDLNATATALITSLLIRAIGTEMNMRDRMKPIVISIPVNLRNYFESKSTLNFFSTVMIKYDISKDGDALENIIAVVKKRFSELLNTKHLQNRLNKLFRLERNPFIRLVPLPIKNIVISTVYNVSSKEITAAVSNLGRITMPDAAKQYIRLFDVFTSTKKLQICMCSFEDNMNISFTSSYINTDIQRTFFRQLTEMGIPVEISANVI